MYYLNDTTNNNQISGKYKYVYTLSLTNGGVFSCCVRFVKF